MYIFLYLSFPDEEITSLSQQSLISSIDGNSAKSLQLSLRLSVCEGVQQIYQQISDKKWNQVCCNYIQHVFDKNTKQNDIANFS